MALPLVKILLLVFIQWNKNRSYIEKITYPLPQLKCIQSTDAPTRTFVLLQYCSFAAILSTILIRRIFHWNIVHTCPHQAHVSLKYVCREYNYSKVPLLTYYNDKRIFHYSSSRTQVKRPPHSQCINVFKTYFPYTYWNKRILLMIKHQMLQDEQDFTEAHCRTSGPWGPESLTWLNRQKVKLITGIILIVWNCQTITDIG